MIDTISKINEKVKVYHSTGSSGFEINQAELNLGVKFSSEYREYLKQYGAISFGCHELTGLNVDDYLSVVSVTKEERKNDINFPSELIVIENIGIEGLLILQDSTGKIYEYSSYKGMKKIFNSLSEYIVDCVRYE